MKPIQANRTNTFSIPITIYKDELKGRSFVRTGSYGDGNCFIHCILRATSSKYRRCNTYEDHIKLVQEFRNNLIEWISPEKYFKLGNGEVSRFSFINEFNELMDNRDTKDILTKIFTSEIVQTNLNKVMVEEKIGKQFYIKFCKLCEDYLKSKYKDIINNTRLEYLKKNLWEYFIGLFKTAHTNSYEKFKRELGTMDNFVESSHMECMSNFIGYNLIFIDTNTDDEKNIETYKGNKFLTDFDPTRKTIVLLWLSSHFEIVGELDRDQYINRVFDSEDIFIKSIQS